MSAKRSAPRHRTSGRGRRRAVRRVHPIISFILLAAIIFAVYWGYANIINPDIALVNGEAAVHFIDVGQGDSVLVQTTQGSVLIDGGDNHMGDRVVAYLRNAGINEITYVIATHPHADHIGGLISVLYEFPVGTLIMPPVAHTTETFRNFLAAIENNDVPLKEPVAGNTFSVGDAVFTIIAPNSYGYQNLNDYSVSVRMVLGSTSFIVTGDAEELSELEMIKAGHYLSSDVLRVGHHGSRTSTTQEFLSAVNPSIAVINVGRDNGHGHPHGVVMNRLQDAGIRIYRTDEHGHIVMVTDGTVISVRGSNRWFTQLTEWITG